MTILPCRNCTSSYESDKIVRFSALVGILEIYKKFNKLVKKYLDKLWKCIENLFKQPRGIQKCNKKGCSTDSSTRYSLWRKSLTNRSGVFYILGLLLADKCLFTRVLVFRCAISEFNLVMSLAIFFKRLPQLKKINPEESHPWKEKLDYCMFDLNLLSVSE